MFFNRFVFQKILRLRDVACQIVSQMPVFRRKGNLLAIVISKMCNNPKESLMSQITKSGPTALLGFRRRDMI